MEELKWAFYILLALAAFVICPLCIIVVAALWLAWVLIGIWR